MLPTLRWVVLVTGCGAAAACSAASGAPDPLRAVTTLAFFLVTGFAFAPLLEHHGSPAALTALGTGLSLALDTLAATVLLVLGAYSPGRAVVVLLVVCTPGCAAQVARRMGRGRVTEVRLHV